MADAPRAGGERQPLLRVSNLTLRFGGITALRDVSFDVAEGEVVALIGPNGAGKTSLLNVVSRLYEPTHGEVMFKGLDLLARSDRSIAELGIARTFQNIAVFPSLDVVHNVALGYAPRLRYGLLQTFLCRPGAAEEKRSVLADARKALFDLGLEEYADRVPDDLPQGILRQVELARALLLEPTLVLLDEPAAGLNSAEIDKLIHAVRRANQERGLAVLLIDHRMDLVMSLADRIVVLNFGRIIADDVPERIRKDEAVLAAYLGEVFDG